MRKLEQARFLAKLARNRKPWRLRQLAELSDRDLELVAADVVCRFLWAVEVDDSFWQKKWEAVLTDAQDTWAHRCVELHEAAAYEAAMAALDRGSHVEP